MVVCMVWIGGGRGDERFLRDLVVRAVEAAGATLLDLRSWVVSGRKDGMSVIAVVLESPVAVHTLGLGMVMLLWTSILVGRTLIRGGRGR